VNGSLRRLLLAVWVFVALAVPGRSQVQPARVGLEARLTALLGFAKLPAVAGALFTAERIEDQSAVGVRRLGADAAVTVGDRWHIGSITKSFTATLVARFVERGDLNLKWTQTLGELLGAERAKAYATVTIEQVLSYRAGMPARQRTTSSQVLSGIRRTRC
jgi:CubicO group peptidase (beta-lactamase class C family)